MPQEIVENKSHYNTIQPLVPPKETQARIDADNAAVRKAMATQLGTFAGYHTDRTTGERWEIRTLPGGHQILAHPAAGDPTSFTVFDPSNQQAGDQTIRMGGQTYSPLIDKLRETVSSQAIDPLTREKWEVDPLQMTYGQLRDAQRHIDLAANSTHASADQVNSISNKFQLAGTLRDLQNDYEAVGGRDGFNYWKNIGQKFSSDTDFNQWANQNKDDPQKTAFLRMMSRYKTLIDQGVNISKLGGGQGNDAMNVVGSALNGVGFKAPLLSLAGAGITGLLKSMGDLPSADALKANILSARGHILDQVYNEASTLAGPEGGVLLPQRQRNMGTAAANELESLGVGPNDTVDEKLGILPEPAKEQVQQAQEKTPELKGATSATETPVQRPKDSGQFNFWNPGSAHSHIWGTNKAPIASVPTGSPSPTPAPTATPNATPAATATPAPAPVERSIPATQRLPFLSNAPIGQGAGQSSAMNIANNLPSLNQQEHVDALSAGQPFRWSDGLTYVKV